MAVIDTPFMVHPIALYYSTRYAEEFAIAEAGMAAHGHPFRATHPQEQEIAETWAQLTPWIVSESNRGTEVQVGFTLPGHGCDTMGGINLVRENGELLPASVWATMWWADRFDPGALH